MFNIVINDSNNSRLEAAINDGQKLARVRTIDVDDLFGAIARISGELGISQTALAGTTATINANAQRFASKYNGIPESTFFDIVATKTGWKLVDVYRARCGEKYCTLSLSETAKAAILKRCETIF